MSRKLYVANLDPSFTEQELARLFTEYGEVMAARVPSKAGTGLSRGFGFVEMKSDRAARAAREALDGREIDGRILAVTSAQARRPFGGGQDSKRS